MPERALLSLNPKDQNRAMHRRHILAGAILLMTASTAAKAADPDNTLVIELSSGGQVLIELFPDVAPKHVARVKELAKAGFYDGIVFHRVIPGFMAQTGDPTGTGTGGSGKGNIMAEFNKKPFKRGTVGAARSQNPNSADSQFFICFAPTPAPERPVHRLGPSDRRHGERRQGRRRRAAGQSHQDDQGPPAVGPELGSASRHVDGCGSLSRFRHRG